jgi:PAS domain S-box-containing protein
MTSKPTYGDLTQKIRLLEEMVTKNERSEKLLCDNNDRLKLLEEHLKDAFFFRLSLPNGKIEYLSPAVFDIFGYAPQKYYRDPTLFRKQFHPRWTDFLKQEWDKLLKGKMKPQYEYKIIHKSGKTKWVQQRNLLVRDSKGTPIELEGLIFDITDRKQIEEYDFIARIGRIIDSTLDINEVYEKFTAEVKKMIPFDNLLVRLKREKVHPPEYVVAYVHGTFGTKWQVGYSFIPGHGSVTREVMRTRKAMMLQPTSAQEIEHRYPMIAESFRMGVRSSMIIPLISREEPIGVLTFHSVKLQAYTPEDLHLAEMIGQQIAGAIANAQLFSHVKDTEKSLRESESRFRAIFEQVAVGVAEVDVATGCYLKVNRRQCEILCMSEEEMLATTFQRVTHPEDDLLLADEVAKMVAGKIGTFSMEMRCVRKDGSIIWAKIAVSPLWETGEKQTRNIIVMEDVTQKKELELELQSTLNKLESRVRDRTIELEEINTALSVLLKKRDNDKKELEEIIRTNIDQLVMPFLHKLKANLSFEENIIFLNILETNLSNIVSPFINHLSSAYRKLTPKEIQIAELIKQGKRSKEIAELFNLSVGTVNMHRNNIRHKLNLRSKGANLRSSLLSMA